MKKLITAAMTLALAAGLASAQIESANIVGYQTIPLVQNGFTATGPTFVPQVGTDGSTATLGDIEAVGNFAPFEDAIQVFNAAGAVVVMATYVSQATLVDWGMDQTHEAGWYDLADEELTGGSLNTFPLPFGYSLTAFTSYEGAGLRYAGEVVQSEVEIPLVQNGFTAAANASPVDLTLGDISANANFAPFEDAIQIFNAAGSVVVMATYVSQATLVDWGMDQTHEAGWYDLADEELTGGSLNAFPIPAGQGLTAFTSYEDAALIIPNPLP